MSLSRVFAESCTSGHLPASSGEGTKIPRRSPKSLSKFGRVARALWPRKTAAELAFRARVTERAAKFWLCGDRAPSADAIGAVIAEMLDRA